MGADFRSLSEWHTQAVEARARQRARHQGRRRMLSRLRHRRGLRDAVDAAPCKGIDAPRDGALHLRNDTIW